MDVSSINENFWRAILGLKQLNLLCTNSKGSMGMYSPWEALLFLFLLCKVLKVEISVFIFYAYDWKEILVSFVPLHI